MKLLQIANGGTNRAMQYVIASAGGVKKVLVCDTQKPDSGALSREFPSDRYDLTICSDLDQARSLAAERDYDVALIELDLPRQQSVNLLKSIHEKHPATKVVMMADCPDEELWVDVLNEGASDLVSRPISRLDLERVL